MKLAVSPQHKGRTICACDLCGTRFLWWTNRERRYCSGACSRQARHMETYVTQPCQTCGRVFESKISAQRKYCALACRPGKKSVDLTGKTFGRLTVISHDAVLSASKKRRFWLCHCACGTRVSVGAAQLKAGTTRSCGCYSHDLFRARATRHGRHGTPEYFVWKDIRKRCTATKGRNYRSYAARGITLCERWHDYAAFLADMGPRPSPRHSIERIDNDRGYEPSNCRWATQSEQMLNTRRSRQPLTYNGKTQPLVDWAQQTGINYYALYTRIHALGWSPSRAFATPIRSNKATGSAD